MADDEQKPDGTEANPFQALEPIADKKVAPAVGIAAMALNFALRYHDINTVQDGALYQQYKLEGRNMRELHLDAVFETAILMEMHLLAGSKRVAELIVDALEVVVTEDDHSDSPQQPQTPGS